MLASVAYAYADSIRLKTNRNQMIMHSYTMKRQRERTLLTLLDLCNADRVRYSLYFLLAAIGSLLFRILRLYNELLYSIEQGSSRIAA